MAKVKIVYVPDKELRGPDLERIGGVEDVPDELARIMVAGGEAVWADEEDETPAEQPSQAKTKSAPVATVADNPPTTQPTDTR
jgi:hypothetical protein